MSTASAARAWRGPALFSFGFRPFFLGAALWAALAVPLWLLAYFGSGAVLGAPGRDWHVHEMLFGYLAAVIAGFLTTAVPNWTGRLPVTGFPLIALFALWVAGRAAMLAEGALGWPADVIDCLFLVAFAAVVWREVLAGKSLKNLPVCAILTVFALANIGLHLRSMAPDVADYAERLAIGAPLVLISLIGGRIIPSFTRNWLAGRGETALPAPAGRLDNVAVGLTIVAVAFWIVRPDGGITGGVLIAAGALNLVRLSRWRGLGAASEPLVWILHVGYLWLAGGLVLLGLTLAFPAAVPRSAGIHALTTGAVGVMTLAVMTRATLGHTGRARTAGAGTTAVYLLAIGAALVRTAAPFAPALQTQLLMLAGSLWSLAFLGFAAVYGPMLVRDRPAKAG